MNKWNFEKVHKLAKKYNHREEFFFAHRGAYNWAQRHNCLDKVFSHMGFVKKNRSFKEVQSIAKKYKYKKDFRLKEPTLYRYASRKKWLSRLCSHMENSYVGSQDNISWNKDKVLKAMNSCRSRNEFRNKYKGAIAWCKRHDCLEYFFKKTGLVNLNKSYTLKELEKEARKHQGRNEFKLKANGYYTSAKKQGLLDIVCKHMEAKCIVWDKYKAKKIIKQYQTMADLSRNEKGLVFWLRKIKKENRKLFNSLVKNLKYNEQQTWTTEEIRKRASKYTTIKEFYIKDRKAYCASLNRGQSFHKKTLEGLESVATLREKKYQEQFVKKLRRFLNKHNSTYKIKEEYRLPKADIKKDAYLDVYLTLNGYKIPIELKHDDSSWTKKHLKEQSSRYNRKLRKRKNILPVFIVSPRGKYGVCEKTFFKELKHYV